MARQEVRSPVADSGSPTSNHNSARPFNDDMAWVIPLFNGAQSSKSTGIPDSLMNSPPRDWDLKYSYEMNGIDGANVEDPTKVFSGPIVASERSEEFSDSEPATSIGPTHIRTFNTESPLAKDSRSPQPAANQKNDLCCPSFATSEVLGKRTRAFSDNRLHGKTSRRETSGPKATGGIPPSESQSPTSVPVTKIRAEAQRHIIEPINNLNQDLKTTRMDWNPGSHQEDSSNDANISQKKTLNHSVDIPKLTLQQLLLHGSQPGSNATSQHQHATSTNVPSQPVKPGPFPVNVRGQQVGTSVPIVDSQNFPHFITKPSMPIHGEVQQTLPQDTPPKIPETTLSVPESMEYQATYKEAPLTSMQVYQDTTKTTMAAPPCIVRRQIASTPVPVAQDNNKVGQSTFLAAQQMVFQSTQRDEHQAAGQSFNADGNQNPHSLSSAALANRKTLDDLSSAIQPMTYQQATEMAIELSNQDIPATFLNPSLESQSLQSALQPLQGTCAASVSAAQQLEIEMLPRSNRHQNAGISSAFPCNGQGDQSVTRTPAYQDAQTTKSSSCGPQNKTVIPFDHETHNNPQQQDKQVLQQQTRTIPYESLTGTAQENVRRHQSNLPHDPRVVHGKQIPASPLQQSMSKSNPFASADTAVQRRMASETAALVVNTASQPNPFSAPSRHSKPPMVNNAQTNTSFQVRQAPVSPTHVGGIPCNSAMTQVFGAHSSLGPVNQVDDSPPHANMQTFMTMTAAAAVSNDYTTALQNAGIPIAFPHNGQGDQSVTKSTAYQGAQTTTSSSFSPQSKVAIPSEEGVQNNLQQQGKKVLQQQTRTKSYESLTGTVSANVRRPQSNLYHDTRVAQEKQIPASQFQQNMAKPNPFASADTTVQRRIASETAAPVVNTASNPFPAYQTVVMPSRPMMNNAQTNIGFQTRQALVFAPDYVGTTSCNSAMTQFSATQSSIGPVNQGADPPPYQKAQTSGRMAAAAAVTNDYTIALQNSDIPTAFPCNVQGGQSVTRITGYQDAQTTISSSHAPQNKIVIPSEQGVKHSPQQQITRVLQSETRSEAYESLTGTASANVRRHQSNFFHDPRVATLVSHGKQILVPQLQQSMAEPNSIASADPTVQRRMPAPVANTASQPNPFSAHSHHSPVTMMNNAQTNIGFQTRQAPVVAPAYVGGTPYHSAMTQLSTTQSSIGPVNRGDDPPTYQNMQTFMRKSATASANDYTTALIRPSASQTTSYYSHGMQVTRSHPNNQRFIQLMNPPAENMMSTTAVATTVSRHQLNTGNTPFGSPAPTCQSTSSTMDQWGSRTVNVTAPLTVNYQQNILGSASFNSVQTTLTLSGQIAATPSYQGTKPTKTGIASATGMSTATALRNDHWYQNSSASHVPSHCSFEPGFQNMHQDRNPPPINPDIQIKQRLLAASSDSKGSQNISTIDFSTFGQSMQHASVGIQPTNSANGGWSNQPSDFPTFPTQPTKSIPSSTSQRAPPAPGPNIAAPPIAPLRYRGSTSTQQPLNSIPAGMSQNSDVDVESLIPQILQHTPDAASSVNPVTQVAATARPASSRYQVFQMTAPIDPAALGMNLAPRMKKEQNIRPAVFRTKNDVVRRVRSFAKFPGVFSIAPTIHRYSKPIAENGFMLYREDLIKCADESCSMMHKLPDFLNTGYQRQWHKAECRFSKAKTA